MRNEVYLMDNYMEVYVTDKCVRGIRYGPMLGITCDNGIRHGQRYASWTMVCAIMVYVMDKALRHGQWYVR